MNGKFDALKSFAMGKAGQLQRAASELKIRTEAGMGQASDAVKAFAEREDTKAAIQKTKDFARDASHEATELAKRAAKSDLGKDAATGAAIGAAVAIPIPIIGPIFGGIVGAGAGMAMNLKSGGSKRPTPPQGQSMEKTPEIDIHQRLIDLDDLRQKGILSQEELDVEKKKLLNFMNRNF